VARVIADLVAAELTEWLGKVLKVSVEVPAQEAAAALNASAGAVMETAAATNTAAASMMEVAATTTTTATAMMGTAASTNITAAGVMEVASANMLAAAAQMATAATSWGGLDLGGSLLRLLPGFQFGAIVTRPSLALVGEAGPEEIRPIGAAAPAGDTFNVTINAIDAQGVASFCMRYGGELASGVANAVRQNHPATRGRFRP
ncbi:hypothetical protein AMK68_03340, partial [candidate division KD3-62 bacterium DG_56]